MSSTPGVGGPQPRLRLAEARIERDWSQQEVADLIGTTHVNVSRWERGITKPNPYFRRKLSRLFGKGEAELDLGRDLDSAPASTPAVPPPSPAPSAQSTTASVGEALYDPAIPLRPAVRLVGREAELASLKARLCAGGNVALTALNGLPGVGKTALSVTLAHDPEIRAHFSDGVLWAGLGPHPNMPGLLSRWGAMLGVSAAEMASLSTTEAWAKALRSAIGSRKMLLVIDDAWHVEEALTFKVGGANCAHLVTTRFPYLATHISVDGATIIQQLSEEDSLALLRLLAPGVVEREVTMAHDLIHAVGGLPLALTLMGNYLRKQAHSGQARRIHAALERLSDAEVRLHISESHGPVESHPSLTSEAPLSLRSVIAVTDQQLDEAARVALYALSAFPPKPNSFSEEAALAVAACSVETLDALIDMGLLESTGSDRYVIHQVIADYAHLHLKEQAPYARLIAYATAYVEAHKKDYELLELESNTILAALEAAHELGRCAELVRGVTAFAPFLLVRALYSVAEEQLHRAHEAANALNDEYGVTSALLYLGEIALRQGNYTQAEIPFQEGLTLARQIGDPERVSALLADLGWVTWRRGEYVQAEAYLQEGLKLARQIGDFERISGLLKVLGSVAANRGDYVQSEVYLKEGLALARQMGDREQICSLLINLGATAGEQGNYVQAEEYFQEGLVLARQIGQREQICVLLINLGEATAGQENYMEAERYFQEGLVLAREIGHIEWVSALLNNLGLMTRKQGNYVQAEKHFQECLALAGQIGRPQIICNALYECGNLYLDLHRIEEAQASFNKMLTIIPKGGQDLLALANYGLARVAAVQGNSQKARALGEASVTALEEMGHRNAYEAKLWLKSLGE